MGTRRPDPGAEGGLLTLGEVVSRSTAFLAERGCGTPRLDAEVLVAYALGCERIDLYTRHDRPLTSAERSAARAAVVRRGRREPVAHIVGRRGFRGISLRSSADALVPRPETELLVELALARAPAGAAVLDWGTGSGAVALALAHEREDLALVALDRSEAALALARENARDLDLEVEWLLSDGFAAVGDRRFAVIAANPPYLSSGELRAGPPELGFEPAEALCAGPEGTEALASIAVGARAHLVHGGWLLAEIGAGQAGAAEALWREAGYEEVVVEPDLAGLPRVVAGRA